MEFLHPVMWHVGSGIMTVNSPSDSGLPCKVTRGYGMTCHWIRPNIPKGPPYWNSISGFDRITVADMSFILW